jgi:hypothetical protein
MSCVQWTASSALPRIGISKYGGGNREQVLGSCETPLGSSVHTTEKTGIWHSGTFHERSVDL